MQLVGVVMASALAAFQVAQVAETSAHILIVYHVIRLTGILQGDLIVAIKDQGDRKGTSLPYTGKSGRMLMRIG